MLVGIMTDDGGASNGNYAAATTAGGIMGADVVGRPATSLVADHDDDGKSSSIGTKGVVAALTPPPPRNDATLAATATAVAGAAACPPVVTDEKKTKADNNSNDNANNNNNVTKSTFSITCPDGSIVHLSTPKDNGSSNNDDDAEDTVLADAGDGETAATATSHIILGRGKYGIPSSASHVSRQACVLRLVDESSVEGQLSCQLVVLGSQPCRITRAKSTKSSGKQSTLFVKSITQIISSSGRGSCSGSNHHDLSPSAITLYDGDVIEPCERPLDVTIEKANEESVYYPFVVRISGGNAGNSTSQNSAAVDNAAVAASSTTLSASNTAETSVATTQTDFGETTKMDGTAFAEASRKMDAAAQMMHQEEGGDSQETVAMTVTLADKTEEHLEQMQLEEGAAEADSNENNVASKATESMSQDKATVGMDVEISAKDPVVETMHKTIDNVENEAAAMSTNSINATDVGQSTEKNGKEGMVNGTVAAKEGLTNSLPGNESSKDRNATNDSAKLLEDQSKEGNNTSPSGTKPSAIDQTANAEGKESPPSSSEESSEEEYDFDDDPRQAIIDILQDIESPGSFAISGSCDGKLLMPGLVVDGVGGIGLPLSEPQARELAKRCEQAPFGRGAETIVDKSVRNTFQLAPENFQITNPSWKNELANLTTKICNGLGVQSSLNVEARLYKLLLYEEGSFFAPHRDSEKEEGMFGTLVVVLPSKYTGGELVVKHKGEKETFAQASASNFGSQYAAFYADCKHELKKVTSGHRLCLVYNLVKVGYGARPRAVDNSSVLKRLTAAAREWGESYDGNKLVLMTEHLYTPAGIKNGSGSSKYKGDDAAVVELLEMAIEKGANIDYDHGTVSLTEYGDAEGDDYYGRSRWYDDYDDRKYTWCETHDRNLSLKLSTYGSVGISEDEEMVPEDYFEDKDPEDETFEPTGNEGVNAERQYADAEAIVIWPRSQRWLIVTNDRTSEMCNYLLKACTEGSAEAESKEECIRKTKVLISRVGSSSSDVKTLMKCIMMIGDAKLAENFLSSSTSASLSLVLDHMQSFIDSFGADTINSAMLSSVNATRFSKDPSGTAMFVLKYCSTVDGKSFNKNLTVGLIRGFVNWLSENKKDHRVPPQTRSNSQPSSIVGRIGGSYVKALMRCILMIGDAKLAEKFLTSYMSVSTGSLDEILDQMQSFIDSFGADVVTPAIITSVNATSFAKDPTATANYLLKYCSTLGKKISNAELTDGLIKGFIDSMCPSNKKDFRVPSKAPDNFPLSSILSLFAGDKHNGSISLNHGALARRVLEGYVWLSCQEVVKETHYQSTSRKKGEGPTLIPSAIHPLLDLCNSFGWAEYETVLINAVGKLCMHGNCDSAIELVEKIAPTNTSSLVTSNDQSRICGQIASITCEKILASSQSSSPYHKPANLATYKKLVKLIGKFCPLQAPRFVEVVKTLDLDSFVYHLVTDASIQSSANREMKGSIDLLTNHCTQILQTRVSSNQSEIVVWRMNSRNHNAAHSSFLGDPCRQVYDWQVRKSDHKRFLADLKPLIRAREVKADSYQPRGRGPWHFKITKLKSCRVPVSSLSTMTCSCSSGSSSRYSSYRSYSQSQTSANCLLKQHKARASKFREDERKLKAIKQLIPAQAPRQQQQPPPLPAPLPPQRLNVMYTTQSLGLTLTLVNNTQITVKGILPSAQNASTLRVNDVLVGINYRRFEQLGLKIQSGSLQKALAMLKETKRPMLVMFERPVANSSRTTNQSLSGEGTEQAAKKRKAPSEVIDLLDDDDDVQIEGVLDAEQAIAKRVKEAADKGEVVEIS